MSKNKKKKRKRLLKKSLKATPRSGNIKNRHHCCFIKAKWKGRYTSAIRDFHYCIIPIPRDTLHRLIHLNVYEIPVPSELAAKRAYENLLLLDENGALSNDDSIEMRLMLLAALFDRSAPATAKGFRDQLAVAHKFYNRPP